MTSRDWTQAASTTRINPLAIAALVCGIVQFGHLFSKVLALTGLAAIVWVTWRSGKSAGQGIAVMV